jgi:hypothetical protein
MERISNLILAEDCTRFMDRMLSEPSEAHAGGRMAGVLPVGSSADALAEEERQ